MSAASLSGPSSVPLSGGAQLNVSFSTDFMFSCTQTGGDCAASVYQLHPGGGKTLISYCYADSDGEPSPCSVGVSGDHWQVEDPLTDSYSTTYQACEGLDEACSTKTVTWAPWEMSMTLTGRSSSDGVEVDVANGGAGWPAGRGYVQLWDENSRSQVGRVGAGPIDPVSFDLGEGCPGPYFRARYLDSHGALKAQSSMVRISGIGGSESACHEDPSGGGPGGDPGGGGDPGSGPQPDPPTPPTAIIDGPTSGQVGDSVNLTVRPSQVTEYPYWLVVRDASRDNAVVASCASNGAAGCDFSILGDTASEGADLHHLVSYTELGSDQVLEGESHDVTFAPFRTKAKIQLLSVRPAEEGVESAGIARLHIENADPRPVSGYTVALWSRDLSVAKPKWRFESACPAFGPLSCDIEYYAGPSEPDKAREVEFKSVVSYLNDVRDQQLLKPPVKFFHGADLERLQMLAQADAAYVCFILQTDFGNKGPRLGNSSINFSTAACIGALSQYAANSVQAASAALAWIIAYLSRDELAQLMAAISHGISDAFNEFTIPWSGETTSGNKIYTQDIQKIADALRRLNKGVTNLTVEAAKATAAACIALSAYKEAYALTGLPLGEDFCTNPSLPMFVVGADAEEAAQHDFDAIFGNFREGKPPRLHWAVLNYAEVGKALVPGTKVGEGQNRRWYRNLPPCKGKVVRDVIDCDEYPYFSARQGSGFSNPRPSIRPIDHGQNKREGDQLGAMIRRCGFESSVGITKTSNGFGGTRYLVLPTPTPSEKTSLGTILWKAPKFASPVTIGLCNGRNSGGGGGTGST